MSIGQIKKNEKIRIKITEVKAVKVNKAKINI